MTGKHLCWSLFLIKLQTFIEKRLQQRCFPVNIAKFLRTAFFTEHLWWLFAILDKCNSFLGDNENKNFLNQFEVNSLKRNAVATNKVIYATTGDKCFRLNDAGTIKYLFCKKEETVSSCQACLVFKFGELIIHTPDTDVGVLGFARSLNCKLLIKTERQE